MIKLADLHKPDLESTERYPEYNKATSQVVILESLKGSDKNARIQAVLSSFQEGKDRFWDEFLQMIDKKHLPEATEIYQRIITRATELAANLETVAVRWSSKSGHSS